MGDLTLWSVSVCPGHQNGRKPTTNGEDCCMKIRTMASFGIFFFKLHFKTLTIAHTLNPSPFPYTFVRLEISFVETYVEGDCFFHQDMKGLDGKLFVCFLFA